MRRPWLLLAVVLCACGEAGEAGAAWLHDATAAVGLDFTHELGAAGTYFLPEIMGPGCALFDADGDGDLDAYLVNAGPNRQGARNRLFLQEPGPRFVDSTARSGLGDAGYGMGVAVGDYDADGDLDVYVTNYGANALYRNDGAATFTDVTAAAGVGCPAWSCSAAFVDYDGDGDLDLFVTNYLHLDPSFFCPDAAGRPDYCGPRDFPGVPDALYRNDGGGRFTDVTGSAGISGTVRRGLGVVCADFTGDGRPDIYVANDNDPNTLWVHRGDGRLVDEALVRGLALNVEGHTEASMGLVCDDLDGDLDLDLFLTHLRGESNTFYGQERPGSFEDETTRRGLHAPSIRFTGFGAVALDVDLDGDLDLVTVNGDVVRGPVFRGADLGPFWNEYAQTRQLYLNDGRGSFTEATARTGGFGSVPAVGRGLAVGDVDGDGAQDLLTVSAGGRARLFLNRVPGRGHWLRVRARDPAAGRDAVGAVVTLTAGDRRQRRRIDPAGSYLSSSAPCAHFGLGTAGRYDALEVRWPDGAVERFPGGAADRALTLVRGRGR